MGRPNVRTPHGRTACNSNIGTTSGDNNMGKPDGQQNGTISSDNSIGLNNEQLYGDKTWNNAMVWNIEM